ncbi:MAG: 1-(5-phosphoribosyl)-5-[(5-phosphoribosylamino)methylideneamino]imidazole-4-carboxamide isomerase [Bacillota bacterium]
MRVIPAIDIRGGNAVRLTQGDYGQEELIDDNPVQRAIFFAKQGAAEIHLVDLDGARKGRPINQDLLNDIISIPELVCQIGGGIRNISTASAYLEIADAIVIGTAAIEDPNFAGELVDKYNSQKIIVALDARNGMLSLSGWEEETAIKVEDMMEELIGQGIERFIYTDINRDGMMAGPNFQKTAELNEYDVEVTASGGIASVEDLKKLQVLGINRAIVGRAIYKGKIDPEKIWKEGIEYAN